MKKNYKLTMFCCFGGCLVQAMVINYLPLLFVVFQDTFGMPLEQITLLVTINFIVQLTVDFLAAFFIDRIGYKVGVIAAHVFCSLGLVGLAFLPDVMATPFGGLLTSVIIYSIGAGLLEVLISPIMESTPSDNKEAAMSLLHSFYSWGFVMVVLVSTLFFWTVGIEHWRLLAVLWAVLPAIVGVGFCFAPVNHLIGEGEVGMSRAALCKNKMFWVMVLMMICAGASEHAVCQWASALAERGLGVSKSIGDLAGPMAFAVLMGSSRVLHSAKGHKWNLRKFIIFSTVLCLVSYLMISLVPNPVINLIGCAICGFSIAIMWPGTLSIAPKLLPLGGTAMYALLALAGDVGCSAGPTLVGFVSGAFGDNLQIGILTACIFPVLILFCLFKGKLGKETE